MADKPTPETEQRAAQQIFESPDLAAHYVNFARISNGLEEVILDLGVDPAAGSTAARNVRITQRVVLNYNTAKRIHAALGEAVRRYDQMVASAKQGQ